MRVRISYSVDLEEVPRESVEMLKGTMEDIQSLLQDVNELLHDIEKSKAPKDQILSVIDRSRKGLSKVDSRLTDVSMIMSGYHDALAQIQQEAAMKESEKELEDAFKDLKENEDVK